MSIKNITQTTKYHTSNNSEVAETIIAEGKEIGINRKEWFHDRQ